MAEQLTFQDVPDGDWFYFDGHPDKPHQKMRGVFAVPDRIQGWFVPRDDAPVVLVNEESREVTP
jgi:hypothetical protein